MSDPLPRTDALPGVPDPAALLPVPPSHIGRYRVERILGQGSFGTVYLAHDDNLQRPVALKVPQPRRLARPGAVEAYLKEAQIVARLRHEHIVQVFDCDRTGDGSCYIATEFLEGGSLAEQMRRRRLTVGESAALVADIAEALQHAHQHHLIHRDVKPSNILLDAAGKPYLTDFGIALRDEDFGTGGNLAGTPWYMSPEQARGESHRVDGRADIYSLGIVLYELLTGERPFRREDAHALLEDIAALDLEARPPRQLVGTLASELERICLKALAKRATERYTTARDFADDLRAFLAQQPALPVPGPTAARVPSPTPDSQTAVLPTGELSPEERLRHVVPRGLRAFEAGDADFFLELLPGPRDRHGLPDSVSFWKQRIATKDPEQAFAVGLLYGPSGCGKSSLVRAGLLPRLGQDVVPVCVEAAADQTEVRLLRGLARHCPGVDADQGLVEALAALRRGEELPRGRKVLLVLDQFEQFLHAHGREGDLELVWALRHCDGIRVQALLLVRDDFWLAVTHFLAQLEIDLVQGHNTAAVDLFDPTHARKVLAAFGRAHGRLAANAQQWTAEQEAFLDQAVAGLAREGRLIPVRLALFAEMVKTRPWTPATLKAVGGTEGVGVAFLEESFSAASANPRHRLHQKAVRGVLRALLPERGTDIKGHLRSRVELEAASGYAAGSREFADLLRILDGELRLVTPTDPEGIREEQLPAPSAAGSYYQLTHDYLVPSVRDWLTRKQRETRRGRAELRLAERVALWQSRRENRHLPAWWEWLNIRLYTHRRDWTAVQQRMMRQAGRYHTRRGVVLLAGLLLLTWGAWEGPGWWEARNLQRRLLEAAPQDVHRVVQDMAAYRRWLDAPLREIAAAAEANQDAPRRLRASLALLPVDERQVDYLYPRLLSAGLPEVLAVREGLRLCQEQVRERLWGVLEDRKRVPEERLRAACALAEYAADDGRWDTVGADVAAALVAQNALEMGHWAEALKPVRQSLLRPLAGILTEEGPDGSQRRAIAQLYAGYAEGQAQALGLLVEVLAEKVGPDATLDAKLALARRQANAAAALAAMGQWDKVLPLLGQSPDPTVRSYLIERLGSWAVDVTALNAQREKTADVSVGRALLLALGDFGKRLQPAERDLLIAPLLTVYEKDADPGMHGAAGWLLRAWGHQGKLAEIDAKLKTGMPEGQRRWYVNGQGQTMVILTPPSEGFWMGEEPERHRQRIGRSFALAAREVTVAEFRRFRRDLNYGEAYAPTEDCPMNSVSWYDAAAYCNWLSAQEGVPKQEWCYEPKEKDQYGAGMKMAKDYLRRRGYRLPTEAEWDYACRAGSETGWSYGEAADLLAKYAWFAGNAGGVSHAVGTKRPNDWGFFDLHGNLWEWCLDRPKDRKPAAEKAIEDIEDNEDIQVIKDQDSRLVRGGAFNADPRGARSAIRSRIGPAGRDGNFGFRPARTYR